MQYFKNWWVKSGILLASVLFAIVMFSPYRYHKDMAYRGIATTIFIAAPIDSVYRYLGNSANAHHWSTFVDHITPLNSDSVPDGHVGSVRRCFKQANEQGIWWDEEILIANAPLHRRLSCFHLTGFALQADHLATDQMYRVVEGGTELTFTVFHPQSASLWLHLKTYFAGYIIASIFEKNLDKVKRQIEQDAVHH